MTFSPELLTGVGAAASVFLSSIGSAIASVHGGMYALHSPFGWYGFGPVIIGGVLSIYGLIIAIILCGRLNASSTSPLSETDGYRHLSAGLAVGFACLCSGMGMGQFVKMSMSPPPSLSSHSRSHNEDDDAAQPLLFSGTSMASPTFFFFPKTITRLMLVLVFLEAIGLYGLIVAVFLSGIVPSSAVVE
jgi:V-type H+-transporting ATPase 16kDa proteolipid subunit